MAELSVTFVAAVNNQTVLHNNLLRSPRLRERQGIQWLFKEGFSSAPMAYNQALDEAQHDLVVFIHQDVYLPEPWLDQLAASIDFLDARKIEWGVLGSFGSHPDAPGGLGRVFTTGLGSHGNAIDEPTPAETLDEIVLVVRKSSGLRFDEKLPHYHMYGVDLCLLARSRGLGCYAIPATCVHNTNQLIDLPAEFVQCYRYVKRKWASALPIAASCITVSRFDRELRLRSLSRLRDKVLGLRATPLPRVQDPRQLMNDPLVRKT
jgi:Glycosyltransferase like family